jgi:choice-of-anchor B domain-containing protein
MPLKQLGQDIEGATSNWGWKDPQTGRCYAIQGSFSREIFVDVTDPTNPVVVGTMPSVVGTPYSRDAETYSNHAFVVADRWNHGMQVFDLTRLRGIESPQTFESDALYSDIGGAINIAINEETGFAYLVSGSGGGSCSGGLHIVDIRVPKSPVQAACYKDAGSINDTQCVVYSGPDPDHQGSEICFAAANPLSSTPNLSIIDVSDKNDIRLLGQTTWPDVGFAHQGWLSKDQRYFLMGDELDELNTGRNTRTIVLDVSKLESPFYVGSHFADTLAVDHNLYRKGNFVYQANMAVGLRILRIDSLAAAELTEVA